MLVNCMIISKYNCYNSPIAMLLLFDRENNQFMFVSCFCIPTKFHWHGNYWQNNLQCKINVRLTIFCYKFYDINSCTSNIYVRNL